MFIVQWAQIAADSKSSLLSIRQPCFRRSLLNPRRPGIVDPTIDRFFIPLNKAPPPPPPPPSGSEDDHLVSRVYRVAAEEVERLQREVSREGRRRSKVVAFSSFLWKIMAKTAGSGAQQCKVGMAVDGRRRVGGGKTLEGYFGNVLSIPYGSKAAEELMERPLWWAADAVQEFLEMATREEHFLGLIDWAEAHRPVTSMAKIYSEGGPAFVVSSGESFPLSTVDFGWGNPIFWSYSFHWPGDTGYVMPMPMPNPNPSSSSSSDCDWVVYMRLLKSQLDLVELHAAHLLRPFSFP